MSGRSHGPLRAQSPTGPWGGNPRESCGGGALLGGRVDSKAGPLFYPARCVQGLPRTSSLWRKQSEGGEPYCQQYAAYMSGLRPPTRPPPPIPKERRRARHNCRTEAPRESPLPTDPTPRQGVSVSRSQGSPGEPCCPGTPRWTSCIDLRSSQGGCLTRTPHALSPWRLRTLLGPVLKQTNMCVSPSPFTSEPWAKCTYIQWEEMGKRTVPVSWKTPTANAMGGMEASSKAPNPASVKTMEQASVMWMRAPLPGMAAPIRGLLAQIWPRLARSS